MSMRLGAVLAFCAAPAVAQQLCLTDHTEMMDRNPEGFDAAIRSVTMAHLPVELRNSCGLLDENDVAYYDALAKTLACTGSETYHQVFSQILTQQTEFLFAAGPGAFRTNGMHDDYCAQVAQIDMPGFVDANGDLDEIHVQEQIPLLQNILAFVAQFQVR
ncbi:MAG: hypothetical protein P8Q92_07005 [Pseudoprimorskyibacter sp.]|nr:hypothetical protein [Pseudoprimorskyibacter sp.]